MHSRVCSNGYDIAYVLRSVKRTNQGETFLDTSSLLYMRVCPSVGPSVRNAFYQTPAALLEQRSRWIYFGKAIKVYADCTSLKGQDRVKFLPLNKRDVRSRIFSPDKVPYARRRYHNSGKLFWWPSSLRRDGLRCRFSMILQIGNKTILRLCCDMTLISEQIGLVGDDWLVCQFYCQQELETSFITIWLNK